MHKAMPIRPRPVMTRLRRRWLIAYGHFEDRFGIISAALNRLATPGMRHSALLLRTDHASA